MEPEIYRYDQERRNPMDKHSDVTVSASLGNFTYEPLRDAKTVVGVVGGSSITPFRRLTIEVPPAVK